MSVKPMNTEQNHAGANTKTKRSTWLLILLIVFIILFLVTTAILGSRLYDMATRDQYTVDLGLGELDGSIELFQIEYNNDNGEITVQGVNGENVIAPGTSVNYDVRLRNKDDVVIDFMLAPKVDYLSQDEVPIQFKMIDTHGNYLLGDEDTWVTPDEVNTLYHKESIHPGEVFTYHVTWRWVFEVDKAQDSYDTYLGNQNGLALPGIRVGIETEAVANPMPAKSISHTTHLLGEGMGCCWCWYVWFW